MEPEGSLPHSQVPATCPYPVPARSSPYHHIPLLEDLSQYYPPIYVWVAQVFSFPQVSPTKTLYTPFLSHTHVTCPTHLIILEFSRIVKRRHSLLFCSPPSPPVSKNFSRPLRLMISYFRSKLCTCRQLVCILYVE